MRRVLVLCCLLQLGVHCNAAIKRVGPRFSKVLAKEHVQLEDDSALSDATFAAGCFWGVQLAFQRIPGVHSTRVGYTGGDGPASYQEVSRGTTGHAEAVTVRFDPRVVSYDELLAVFFEIHDPTTLNRQGNDFGTQYRSAVFYHSPSQQSAAEKAVEAWQALHSRSVATQIVPAAEFHDAEDYHQAYLQKLGQSAAKGDLSDIRCYG